MTDWFLNGEAIASVPLGDRAMLYGDGLFETIAIRDGRPRFWPLHVDRLQDGCRRLGLAAPDPSWLRAHIDSALESTMLDPAWLTAKIVVSAGGGPRGYRRPDDDGPRCYTSLSDGPRLERAVYTDGTDVRICETRASIQPRIAGIKSLNRLDQVLARNEWQTATPWEGLMLDVDGYLICGTMSNVFLVHDNAYSTPMLDRSGVAGIMRRHLIDLLAAAATPCAERRLTLDDLAAADEVFLTNSQVGAVPVAAVGERALVPGAATRQAMRLLAENGVPECAP